MTKARVLLVEDSQLQAESTMEFLVRDGYEVIWAEDGKAAIKAVKSQTIDIILLDLVLPDMTGNQLCRWLKLTDETRGIPIIMLTVKAELNDKVAGLEAGADDYLPKPYNEVELNARIYASLRTKALQDELKKKNHQLEELLVRVEVMATKDPLTSLHNRRHFEAAFKKEFIRSMRYRDPLTCFMLDIDHFKNINDKFGHNTGDAVLKEVSQIISCSLREVDLIARWGGEEFIVILPSTGIEGALIPASRILKSISESRISGLPPEERITISIGIAGIPNPIIDTAEKMIKMADQALYMAKNNGRNRFEVYQIEAGL